MEYFKLLNLTKEPFSNSPDPDFFFQSAQHVDCLQKLELSLRLRRGLNVVIGDVGTGKTTLCRQLIRKFATDADFETLLILDPHFKTPRDALEVLADLFTIEGAGAGEDGFSERNVKEQIKHHLFTKGVEEGKTTVLIIDEGQKIPLFLIEILRELLNYETNQYKLLQIVIFAQKEFEQILSRYANFSDRINLYHRLNPLHFSEMVRMIRFRLEKAGYEGKLSSFVSYPALWRIYRTTGGYPRKIIHLCHQAMLMMIIQNRSRIGSSLVRACAKNELFNSSSRRGWAPTGFFFLTAIVVLFLFLISNFPIGQLNRPRSKPELATAAISGEDKDILKQHENEVLRATEGHAPNPPTVLGQISVKKEETLGELIRSIYGTYNPQLLQDVLAANPHIESPRRLSIGDVVSFPAIHFESAPVLSNRYRIVIGETPRLKDALALSKSYSIQKKAAVRIVPHWNRSSDLSFTLILDEYLPDEAYARDRTSELQPKFDQPLMIAKGWAPDTVLYGALPNPNF